VSRGSLWLIIGFGGQALFTARFVVQWLASERNRASVVPAAFWWFSLLGGLALLAYACERRDPVIVAGQTMGLFVYTRNLMLIARARRRAARRSIPGLAPVRSLAISFGHAIPPDPPPRSD
jgi:lipid-A-disaccharide synthase-like uncharacterized protein